MGAETTTKTILQLGIWTDSSCTTPHSSTPNMSVETGVCINASTTSIKYSKFTCTGDAAYREFTYSDSTCTTQTNVENHNYTSVGNCVNKGTYNKILVKCGTSMSCSLRAGSTAWYTKWKCVASSSSSSSSSATTGKASTSGAPITAMGSSTVVLAILA